MNHPTSLCEHRLGRRQLLSLAGAVFAAGATGARADAHTATPTPSQAASDAGTKEATPVGSPVAAPVSTGPVFESTIRSFQFLPPEIDIETGTTVIWTNNDVVVHTVTHRANATDQLFSSPFLTPSQTFSYTFDKPGIYPIFCMPHPFMTQTVMVKEKP